MFEPTYDAAGAERRPFGALRGLSGSAVRHIMAEPLRTIHTYRKLVKLRKTLVIAIACTISVSIRTEAQSPLDHAHAHNDYEHARPLLDALDCGFGSVEADIYLVDGALLVAHARDSVHA